MLPSGVLQCAVLLCSCRNSQLGPPSHRLSVAPPCLHIRLSRLPQICSLSQPCYYTAASLALLVVTYLVLFFLASNLIVPGGLFM